MNNRGAEELYQYGKIVIGTMLVAFAVVSYFDILHVVSGGATGIAVILKGMFDIPMWLVNGLINLPLFFMAHRILSPGNFTKTLTATVLLTLFLGIFPPMDVLTGDALLDIIIGGVIMGAGLGIIFSTNASSGGSDLAATLLNKKIPYISVPKIMAIIDIAVVLAGITAFGAGQAVYSIVAICIIAKTSDYIMTGPNHAKLIYIISERYEEIAGYIMCELERGASYVKLTGAYTKNERNMIMCVASPKEMVKIREYCYELDENAMLFAGDIREAFGEGFTKKRG
jgi:uncharacterized membrane-anchored protein YitT (DUF2179 family)